MKSVSDVTHNGPGFTTHPAHTYGSGHYPASAIQVHSKYEYKGWSARNDSSSGNYRTVARRSSCPNEQRPQSPRSPCCGYHHHDLPTLSQSRHAMLGSGEPRPGHSMGNSNYYQRPAQPQGVNVGRRSRVQSSEQDDYITSHQRNDRHIDHRN